MLLLQEDFQENQENKDEPEPWTSAENWHTLFVSSMSSSIISITHISFIKLGRSLIGR